MTEPDAAAPGLDHDLRLALPVAVAWALLGILLGVDGALGPIAVAGALVAVIAGVAALRLRGLNGVSGHRGHRGHRGLSGHRAGRFLVAIALASTASALLLGAAASSSGERRPPELLEVAEGMRHVSAEATLTQAVVDNNANANANAGAGAAPIRVRAVLDSVRSLDGEIAVAVPVTVFARFDAPAEIGDRVSLSGTLAATSPADSSAFLFFARGDVAVTPGEPGPVAWAGQLRGGFRTLVETLPGQGAGLLPGLAIGDTSAVDPMLGEAMKGSSLTHLTAVSGANCAIVVGLVLALATALRLARWLRIAASLLALALFVLIVTPEPSVLRAAVMAVVVLIARLAGRGAVGVPLLALAVLLLLAIDPWLARSYGFILSVFATAGLLVLAGPLATRLNRIMPLPLAMVVAVPLAAQLACQPVLILLEPAVPVYGVVANILAGPAAPAATVLGLIACVLAPVAPWLAMPIAWLAWVPSAWIAAVAMMFDGLPGSRVPWEAGAPGLVLAAALTVTGLGIVLARRRRWWMLGLCGVLIVVGGVTAGARLATVLHRPADWQFAACDIGQGDAVLLRSGAAVMLVDTGPDPGALGECLDSLGVDHLDTVVITHFDHDHVGGIDAVRGRIGRVVSGAPDSAADAELLRDLADDGAEVLQGERGLRGTLGELTWSVLWPPRASTVPPGNDASVVLAVSGGADCGCLSSVLLGDLGTEAQIRMLAQSRADLAALGSVDVVKVSHHGSADQHGGLYEALAAPLGVIGVGADNSYGHPAPSILAVLDRAGTTVGRTDRHGLILAWKQEDGSIGLWSERGAEDVGAQH